MSVAPTDGFGDFLFGVKAAAALERLFPDADVRLACPAAHAFSRLRCAEHYGLRHPLTSPDVLAAGPPLSLLVAGPCLQQQKTFLSTLAPHTPVLLMDEYGGGGALPTGLPNHVAYLSTGVGRDAAGIFIEPEGCPPRCTDAADRHAALSRFASACGPELLNSRTPAEYADAVDLYVVHATTGLFTRLFVEDVLATHAREKQGRGVDIVIVDGGAIEDGDSRHEMLHRAFVAPQATHSPALLSLAATDAADGGSSSRATSNATVPRARLLLVPPMAHEAFVDGLRVARVVGVTGDQSLSEAIFYSTPLVYEERYHKRGLADALRERADQLGVASIARTLTCTPWAGCIAAATAPETRTFWRAVAEQHNLERALGERVASCVATAERRSVDDASSGC